MRILHVIDSVDPRLGGPPAVAVQLSAAQAGAGHTVTLVSHGHDQGGGRPLPRSFDWVPRVSEVTQVTVARESGIAALRVVKAREALEARMGEADVVHLHGVWEPLLWSAASIARSRGVPYVVRPAGMLDPWSLSQKWAKKRAALALGFRRMLEGAAFVHALNRDERDLVGLLGLSCPVEVVPNGVFVESLAGAPPAGTFRARYPQLGDRPFALFLSRLHYKKGLDYLADAFQTIASRMPELMLAVAGPDDGARAGFEKQIERYRLTDRVVMTGPLYGADKLAALTDATVFCLPSRQEGFSVAILESLAMGLPAVVSDECHFPEVSDSGAGRVVRLDPRAIGESVLRVAQDREMRATMSAKARKLIEENYTWPRIGRRCVELYLKRGARDAAPPAPTEAETGAAEARVTVGGPALRVLHVVRSLDPAAGGPPVIALKLATAMSDLGHEAHMLGYRVPDAEDDVRAMLSTIPNAARVEQHQLPPETWGERVTGAKARRMARSLVRRFDVVHLHGLWESMLVAVASECRAAGVPYVVTPHGMLDPWSMQQSTWKKRAALRLAVRRMIDGAMFLHLGNRDERELIGPLGFRAKSELIPNGVFAAEVSDLPAPGKFRAQFPKLGDAPFVLFLSRLHYKKGLDYLADAYALLAPRVPHVHLVVAGPDGGAKADFERRIAAAGLQDRVHLVGPIYGKLKDAAVVDCAVFCLPSRQEGFSMAITEAMGSERPCVVSKACHYPEVQESGAGYCTELEPREIADRLFDVLSDPDAGDRMGRAGRELVLSRFTWHKIAELACGHYVRHGVRPHDG